MEQAVTDRREDPPSPGTSGLSIPTLTVVVPCHNEELNIPALYDALKTHMASCVSELRDHFRG